MPIFYSHGKLLLTGEYVVLDGAISLAIPTKYGQSLEVEFIEETKVIWTSIDEKGAIWFEDTFEINADDISKVTGKLNNSHSTDISNQVVKILNAIKKLNPAFFISKNGFKITTKLDFPRHWGLGTSSTLINNISQWTGVNAYNILEITFGGSGYDIACAQCAAPLTYQLNPFKSSEVDRHVKKVAFNPPFKEKLYFVYLNQKQNSRDGILRYKENKGKEFQSIISEINDITTKLINCDSLNIFENLIIKHETIISKLINMKPVKDRLFNDFEGSIKSLGAWGGDFILVASENNPEIYFKSKGYHTILSYKEMTL